MIREKRREERGASTSIPGAKGTRNERIQKKSKSGIFTKWTKICENCRIWDHGTLPGETFKISFHGQCTPGSPNDINHTIWFLKRHRHRYPWCLGRYEPNYVKIVVISGTRIHCPGKLLKKVSPGSVPLVSQTTFFTQFGSSKDIDAGTPSAQGYMNRIV